VKNIRPLTPAKRKEWSIDSCWRMVFTSFINVYLYLFRYFVRKYFQTILLQIILRILSVLVKWVYDTIILRYYITSDSQISDCWGWACCNKTIKAICIRWYRILKRISQCKNNYHNHYRSYSLMTRKYFVLLFLFCVNKTCNKVLYYYYNCLFLRKNNRFHWTVSWVHNLQ